MEKLVLTILVIICNIGTTFAAETKFKDANDDVITWISDLGLMSGYPDGTFRPNNIVTRAEMSTILTRVVDNPLHVEFLLKTNKVASLSDVQNTKWAEKSIQFMQYRKIINGYPDRTFRGNSPIKWTEFSALTSRSLLDYNGPNYPTDHLNKLASLGIKPKNQFKNVTRYEAAWTIYTLAHADKNTADILKKYIYSNQLLAYAQNKKDEEMLKILALYDESSVGADNITFSILASDKSQAIFPAFRLPLDIFFGFGNKILFAIKSHSTNDSKIEPITYSAGVLE